jgi:FG-GAP-like repeat
VQVAVADVNGDGFLELLALDARGSAALFNASGALLWDIHTGGAAAAAATFGDIDGDGRLDATWGTGTGEVHAVVAATGALLALCAFTQSVWAHVYCCVSELTRILPTLRVLGSSE